MKSKTRHFDLPNMHSIDSALLYLRSQSLKPDAAQRVVVYPATSAYLCTLTPAGRDHITVPAGSYDALKLDLQLNKIGGKRELLPHKKFRTRHHLDFGRCRSARAPDRGANFCGHGFHRIAVGALR